MDAEQARRSGAHSNTGTPRQSASFDSTYGRGSIDSTTSARSRTNSIRAPDVSPSQHGASPLAAAGIKGDGLMLFVTAFASIGVFLFGYDQGVMSGIITGPYFKLYFHNPTSYEIGTMVAILEIGALVTSLACGTLADTLGRKKVLFWGAVTFSIGGLIQTCTQGFLSMVIGRIIAGFGVGALSMIVPTYQSEISPAENRGKLACIEFTGNIVGYASSVWIDYFCSYLPGHLSWRLPLAIQVVIGTILAVGSLLLPESPRWLLDKDRDEEAMRVLADLHGGGDPRQPRARLEYREIKESVLFMRSQGDRGYKSMFKRYWYRTLIACSSQMFAQLNGINVISYYAPLVFESAGWVGRDAILMAGINGIIYIASTIPTWFLIDVLGRKAILMSGSVVTGAALAACGYFLYLDVSYTPQAVVACVIIFNAAFGASWGPIPWLYPAEIMPGPYRSKGTSLSTATNWLFNWIVGEATPVLQEVLRWRLYFVHSFFCFLSLVVVYFYYGETMGVALEEMDTIFGEEGPPIPQEGDEEGEEGDTSDSPARPLRRSISSHPRFMTLEERDAREAAKKVAKMQERERGESRRGVRGILDLFSSRGNSSVHEGTAYTPVSRDEQ